MLARRALQEVLMRRVLLLLLLIPACGSDNPNNTPDDLSVPDDLTVSHDLRPAADLTEPPDLAENADLFMCTPNLFLGCSGDDAPFCNAAGTGTPSASCGTGGASCMGSIDMGTPGCGQCTAASCTGGT